MLGLGPGVRHIQHIGAKKEAGRGVPSRWLPQASENQLENRDDNRARGVPLDFHCPAEMLNESPATYSQLSRCSHS